MTDKRRSRGTGRSPAGRNARRSTRTAKVPVRAPRKTTTNGGLRLIDRRGPARKPKSQRTERTILGLSTGRAIILAVVLCALGLTLAVPLRTYFSQRSDSSHLQAQRVELEHQLTALRQKRDQQHDPAYIRAQARDRLRLVQPGETPYEVQLPGAYEAAQAASDHAKASKAPWYSQLWRSISQPPDGPATAPAPTPPPPTPPAGTPTPAPKTTGPVG